MRRRGASAERDVFERAMALLDQALENLNQSVAEVHAELIRREEKEKEQR